MNIQHYRIDGRDEEFLLEAAQKVLQQLQSNPASTVILDHCWEAHQDPVHWLACLEKFFNVIKARPSTSRLLLVTDNWWQSYAVNLQQFGLDDILYIDYFLYRAYREIVYFKKYKTNPEWNSDTNKFLFLTGFPNKLNRFRLLWKFHTAGLLNCCEWSFNLPQSHTVLQQLTRDSVPELSQHEFDALVNKLQRQADHVSMDTQNEVVTYIGQDYDVRLYQQTSFSVVPETFFKTTGPAWLTEKTWKAIINHHPFIIAGDKQSLSRLNDMGFDTFEKYLSTPNYNELAGTDLGLDAIVDCSKHWIDNIHQYQVEIYNGTQHNYRLLERLYFENLNKIENFKSIHQLSIAIDDLVDIKQKSSVLSIEDICKLKNQQKFKIFYNNVKDTSWPDCDSEDEFLRLPKNIINECVTIHGYKIET